MKFPKKVYVYKTDVEYFDDGTEDNETGFLSLEVEVGDVPDASDRSEHVAIYVLQEVGTIETVSKFKKAK